MRGLHNARAILADFARNGREVFELFSAPTVEHTLGYYRDLAYWFSQYQGDDIGMRRLAAGLDDTIHELETAVELGRRPEPEESK